MRHDLPHPALSRGLPAARPTALAGGRLRGALATAAGLAALWAGFHWDDPASWAVGVPTVLIGSAATLLLPASPPPQLSARGVLSLTGFAVAGILRGAIDVGWRSLAPASLRPGCLTWRSVLPPGRSRRLFALAITLMPGTLTARLEGDRLTVHALDRGPGTELELAALEARISRAFRLTLPEGRA